MYFLFYTSEIKLTKDVFYLTSEETKQVIHGDDAFAPVIYLKLLKYRMEDKPRLSLLQKKTVSSFTYIASTNEITLNPKSDIVEETQLIMTQIKGLLEIISNYDLLTC